MVDVSILLPTYHGDLTITRAIRSALNQPGVSVEVIVTDNGVDRRTPLPDVPLISIYNPVNLGPGGSLEVGANAATGRYCLMLGDDDWLEPGCLAPLVKVMDTNPALAFVYGATQYYGERSDVHRPSPFRRDDFNHHFPSLYAYVWRRDWKAQYGLKYQDEIYEGGRWLGAPDWDMALQLLRHGDALCLPDILVLRYLLKAGRNADLVRQAEGRVADSMRTRHPELKAVTI